jgi:xanthine dehydrogenase YagS FAD-binding subunit
MLPNFTYVRCHTLNEAIQHLSSRNAKLLAGGTDLLGCLRDAVFDASKLVSINRLNNLRGIAETGEGGLRIGALTTVTQVAENQAIKERYRALAQGAAEVGSPQLRNQGTIGGNICQKPRCWYYRGEFHCLRKGGQLCYALGGENQYHGIFGSDGKCCIVHPSDIAPALVAYGSQVRITGPKGNRLVPLENFYVLPRENVEKETILKQGDVVTHILVPRAPKGLRSSYRKVRVRRSFDFALAGVALALVFQGDRIQSARVVMSGAAPIPWRSKEVEQVITGKNLNPAIIAEAAQAAVKNAQPLAHNDYKIALFKAIIQEELMAISKG